MADTQQVVREFLDLSVEEKEQAKEATAFVVVLVGGGSLLYDSEAVTPRG